ncbi:hypothetical protein BHE74_00055783 [Ensete ventricosum]|nr:hypothetical protein GW17_00048430 [Ensete ventricosum]RWW38933.1 hypothetical protein BHE74_00055783 [Ensete ventricosum]
MAAATTPDLLFGLRNSFYLGAYQAAINSSDIPNLPAADALERDVLVHRSYIALGSYQVILFLSSSSPTGSRLLDPKISISDWVSGLPSARPQRDRFVSSYCPPGRQIARPVPLRRQEFSLIHFLVTKESAISSLQEWLSDAAISNNPVLRLIAGIIYMHEQEYNEALKHTNSGGTMEL